MTLESLQPYGCGDFFVSVVFSKKTHITQSANFIMLLNAHAVD